MKWIFILGLFVGAASNASATTCYYFKDLPNNLKQYRDPLDKELYETQGSMITPKSVAGCDFDVCSAWVKCDNGPGRPWIKAKASCKAVSGACPTASACADDQDVQTDNKFTMANSSLDTRSIKTEEKSGVE